ncbi:metallophosphoesterase [candidate division KSB1 bacterium]
MKIGIVSDSHDNKENIKQAVRYFNNERVDQVIHAGDIVAPFTFEEFRKLNAPMTAVFGNCDGERIGLKNVFKDIHTAPYECEYDGKKFVIMHKPDNIETLVSAGLFDYVVYGHLHKVDIRKGSTTVINPGELCGWSTGKSTVVLLETKTNEVSVYEL